MTRQYIEAAKSFFFVDEIAFVSPSTPVEGEEYRSYRVHLKSGNRVELYENRDDSAAIDREEFIKRLKQALQAK